MIRIALVVLTALASSMGAARAAGAGDPPWTVVYDRAAPQATAIEMFDDRRGLAVIGYGVQRTDDGGRTWTEPDPSAGVGGGNIAFGDADRAWVAGYSGVMLRTDDGGLTWRRQQTGTEAHFNGIAAVSATEAWATAYGTGFSDVAPFERQDSVLLHTTDGGATWQPVRLSNYGIFFGVWSVGEDLWLLASPCRPGDPFRESPGGRAPCTDRYTLLQSDDSGGSWSELAQEPAPVPTAIRWVDNRRAFGISNICGATSCSNDLFATDDGGSTWTRLPPVAGPDVRVLDLRFAGISDGWALLQDCSGSGCLLRLARTQDGGQTWRLVDAPPAPIVSAVLALTSTTVIVSGVATGIERYDSRAGEWSSAQTDARPALDSIAFTTRDRGYAVANGALWATDDGGATWAPSPPVPEPLNNVVPAAGVLWVTTAESHLYRSDDGGRTWRGLAVPAEAAASSGFGLHAADGVRAWLTLTDGLWRTDDGGATWRLVDASSFGLYQFVSRDFGWTTACGPTSCDNAIRVTNDGGDTWETRAIPERAYVRFFATPLEGWGSIFDPVEASGVQCPCVIITHDGGRSWQSIPTAPWSLESIYFADAMNGWATAYDLGAFPSSKPAVLATRDGGLTWATDLELSGSSGALLPAAGRLWLRVGRSGNPWTLGRVLLYRRDVPDGTLPRLIPPETGTGAGTDSNGPSVSMVLGLIVAAGLALTIAIALRHGRRRPASRSLQHLTSNLQPRPVSPTHPLTPALPLRHNLD